MKLNILINKYKCYKHYDTDITDKFMILFIMDYNIHFRNLLRLLTKWRYHDRVRYSYGNISSKCMNLEIYVWNNNISKKYKYDINTKNLVYEYKKFIRDFSYIRFISA